MSLAQHDTTTGLHIIVERQVAAQRAIAEGQRGRQTQPRRRSGLHIRLAAFLSVLRRQPLAAAPDGRL